MTAGRRIDSFLAMTQAAMVTSKSMFVIHIVVPGGRCAVLSVALVVLGAGLVVLGAALAVLNK
jgi:hypothetical protein